ncbi:NlpC/P60 family protein [Streptomyces sp. NPDC054796]
MASHRKPKPRPLTGSAARTALTLALAAAASTTAFQGSGHADPRPGSTAQVKAKVDKLHHEAEKATEAYNGAKEKADEAAEELEELRDQAARKQERLNATRDALGAHAAAEYRSGGVDPSLQLALSSSPENYLDRAAVAERAGARQADSVRRVGEQARGVRQLREEAAGTAASLKSAADSARRHKRTVQSKLREAERLLDRLTPEKRAEVLGDDGHGGAPDGPDGSDGSDGTARADRSGSGSGGGAREATAPATGVAPDSRAARAVSFARGALGKPYVWGATGPDAYDCSGLTQAAWKAAGVSLPRTTYTQIEAGRRIPRSGLAPGDLVFFYGSVSHVGLYIGEGRMIHAPRPGAPVRIAPIDEMPFSGATRPA